MKSFFYLTLFVSLLIGSISFANSCVSKDVAKELLSTYLSSNSSYPDSFSQQSLLGNLSWFDDHYHAESSFEVEVDCDYGDINCTKFNSGLVLANVRCDGEVQLVFSFEHD